MLAERVLVACLAIAGILVFFEADAARAQYVSVAALGVAWATALRVGILSPGLPALGLTAGALAWLALTAQLSPTGARWDAVGWAAVGLTLPLLVLRAAHTPVRITVGVLSLVTASFVVLVQAVAWSSGPDEARLFVYAPTLQWSGYPELGLLACLGAGALIGIAMSANTRRPLRLSAALLGVAFAAATIPLGSRSAMVTVATIPIGLLASRLAVRIPPRRLAIGVAAGLTLGLGVLLGTSLGEQAATVLFDPIAAWSVTLRQRTWQHAIEAVTARPWLGYGMGGVAGEAPQELAHNFWLHTAVESGVPGMLLLSSLWLRAAWISLRASVSGSQRHVAFAVYGALLAFLVRSLTDHFLSPVTPGYWRMWLVQGAWLGLAEAVRWHSDSQV